MRWGKIATAEKGIRGFWLGMREGTRSPGLQLQACIRNKIGEFLSFCRKFKYWNNEGLL
jgi:hypothetical protein